MVTIRPLTRGDGATLLAIHEGLSDASRFFRYLGPVPRLSTAALRALTDVDGDARAGILAFDGDDPVGVARYVRDRVDPDRAEFALEVVDRMQHQGIGRLLLRELAVAAAARGVRSFTFTVHPDNRTVLRWLAAEGATWTFDGSAMVGELTVPLRRSARVAEPAA